MIHRSLALILVGVALLYPRAVPAGGTLHSSISIRNISSQQSLGAYSPDDIRTAYDFSPLYDQGLDGTGQTIALIEIDSFNLSDIQYFDSVNSLPDPAISEFYAGGKQFTLPKDGEAAMDIEWLHALAPGAAIQVYYIDNRKSIVANWKDIGTAVQQAANSGAQIISMSIGTCRAGMGSDFTRSALRTVTQHGVSVFISSGDDGDHPGTVRDCGKKLGVAYPGSDPSVVAVGGTSLQLNGSSMIAKEWAWKHSGGGQATGIARPSWQKAKTLAKDRYRWVPDVSFLGDPNTGVSMYFKGRFHQVGGTSLGAPCWAAAWALLLESAQNDGVTLPAAPTLLYQIGNSPSLYKQAFHDVTTGTNGHYKAGAGWDPVTGWGTPDVAQLSQAAESLSQ